MEAKSQENIRNSSVRYLDQCLYYGFHVLVIILPLIFSYKITYDQFDIAKLTFLRITTIFLFLCFATKFLLEDKVRIKRSSLDYPILIFLVLILISSSFSIHPTTSLFGKYKRYEGLFTVINYGLLFFLASQFFNDVNQIKSIARSMIIAAGLVSIYGLLQHFGLDFINWANLPFESSRSFSTFGNPVLLGGYLVAVLPISLGLLFSAPGFKQQLIFGVLALLVFSCLVATFSRGAWLGGFFSLVGFFVLGLKELEKKRKDFLLIFAFLIVTISLFVLFSFLFTKSTVNFKERISSSISLKGSALTRLEIWNSAVKMIEARPVLGFGPDCFRLVFRKYQTLKYKRLAGKTSIADNAHNYFLQLASMAGLPAVFCFITIIGLFFSSTRKFLQSLKGRPEYLIFMSFALSVFGYLLHLFFGVSVVGSTSFLWLILGITAGVNSNFTLEFVWKNSQLFRRFLLAGALLISLLLISLSVFPFIGDFHYAKANSLAEVGYYERSVNEYKKASLYVPYLDNCYFELGSLNFKWAKATKKKKYFYRAVEALETAEKISPLETDNYLRLASIYIFGATEFDSRYYTKAVNQLKAVLIIEPYSSWAYYLLGSTYVYVGDFTEAVKNLKRAVVITPDFEDAYFYLGFAYERLGKEKEATTAYRMALSLNSKNWWAKKALKRLKSQ